MENNELLQKIEILEKKMADMEASRGLRAFMRRAFSRSSFIIGVAAAAALTGFLAWAAQIEFTNGTVISAADVNSNFSELYSRVTPIYSWFQQNISGCPTGYTKIGASCIENDFSSTNTFTNAVDECYNAGGRLCNIQELTYACTNRSTLGLTFPDETWLWTGAADYKYWNNGNFYIGYTTYRRSGTKCVGDYVNPSTATLSWTDPAANISYVCCKN